MRYQIRKTETFDRWFLSLRDRVAFKAIVKRLDRAAIGNLGDVKSVGFGISEMRIFIGKGYRLYFTLLNDELILLLCGGDKSSQSRDIKQARVLLNKLEVQ